MKQFLLKSHLAEVFAREGFELSGVFDFSFLYGDGPSPLQNDLQKYQDWLQNNWHAQMSFMEKNLDVRLDARKILENVRSAIVLLIPYATGERVRKSRFDHDSKNSLQSQPESAFIKSIARYARGKDYHKIIKARGENAIEELKKILPQTFEARTVVDSVPFFERAHAKQAGLGFIGKNTMLIRPGVGSFFFIATVLTTLSMNELCSEKEVSSALENLSCGTCRKCIEACPTEALTEYQLDANKCLSYLSIEHRDTVANELIPHFKDIFFGCDICQTACPYNYTTTDALRISELTKTNRSFLFLSLEKIAMMNFSEYENWFGGTSLTRAKYGGLVRNALYALLAQQHSGLGLILKSRQHDPDELIQKTIRQIVHFN